MGIIRTLPDDVARRIAAGEVVERPASVVKELFENAIDAGARSVTVSTLGAGESLIEIRDDGDGLDRSDLELATRNFATSKIQHSDDLQCIATYGFRGEALASISSVSRFEMITSDSDDGQGWRIHVDGKQASPSEPAPRERGTTVRVRDLFFNTPARKRFLKSPNTERKRILETVLSFALILPEVEIHYIDDGRHVLDLLPAAAWRERVAAVLGATAMKHVVEVDSGLGTHRVTGFVSLPTYTRGNRNHQFFFVNRRSVRERTVVTALHDAYRNVIPYKRFPIAVLAVDVPAEEVDVNVHPTKMEVRVRNERVLFSTLRAAVKKGLSADAENAMSVGVGDSGAGASAVREVPGERSGEFFSRNAGSQPARPAGAPSKVISLQDRVRDAYSDYLGKVPGESSPNPQLSLRASDPGEGTREAFESLRQKNLGDEGLFWQFSNSYIFIQVRGGIVVIDQHAAHERIIFDTTKKQLEGSAPASQQILFSIHLELSMRELEVFRGSQDLFRRFGFDLDSFGGKSILVRGYPAGLRNWEEGRLLLEIFDDIINERFPGDSLSDRLVASFACRSAIRAGQRLSVDEMRTLADQLFAIENPYSCPHGRPTIHRLSLDEIGRWFHRR